MPGDLGNEVAGAAVGAVSNAIPKTAEMTMQIIEKMFQLYKEQKRNEIDKIKLNNLLTEKEKAERIRQIDGMQGCLNHDLLKRYAEEKGTYLVQTGVTLDDPDTMVRFSELAKRNGIKWSAMDNSSDVMGIRTIHIETLPQDLESVKNLFELIADEKKVKSIDSKIQEMKELGLDENSDEIEGLKSAKQEIINKHTSQFNQKVYIDAIDKVLNNDKIDENIKIPHGEEFSNGGNVAVNGREIIKEEGEVKDTLSIALDRDTGRGFDVGRRCYIVDASDPYRYVLATSEKDTFHDKEYIKTTYEVHNPNGKVTSYNDARFENRPRNYWPETKKKIAKDGGFQPDAKLMMFYDENEFRKWQERTVRENRKENVTRTFDGDYQSRINENMESLKKLGCEIREDDLYHIEKNAKVGDLLKSEQHGETDGRSRLSALNYAEAICIYDQTKQMQALSKLDEEYTMAKAEALLQEGGKEKLESLMAQRDQLIGRVEELEKDRRNINGFENQAREDIRKENSLSDLPESEIDWNEEEFKRDDERFPTSREESVEVEETPVNDTPERGKELRMVDYEKLISDERAGNGAKEVGDSIKEATKEVSKIKDDLSR